MKIIPLGLQSQLHIYLVEVKHQGLEVFHESISQEEDVNREDDGYRKAAKELIDSFENHWCVALLEAINEECAERIVEHWKRFSPKRLEEPQYARFLKD